MFPSLLVVAMQSVRHVKIQLVMEVANPGSSEKTAQLILVSECLLREPALPLRVKRRLFANPSKASACGGSAVLESPLSQVV
jgi:hypothetical protein